MKILIGVFLIFLCQVSTGQVFNLKQDWFEKRSFISDSLIVLHNIKEIRVLIYNKLDGKKIDNSNKRIVYQFDKNGMQTQGIIINKFGRRLDSSLLELTYNKGNIQTKTETYSFFKFQYIYNYNEEGLIVAEKKIDQKNFPIDTLYDRKYSYEFYAKGYERRTLNKAEKAFILLTKKVENNTIKERTSYIRNSNFSEKRFFHSRGILSSKELVSKFGEETIERTEYRYKLNRLDESNHFLDGELQKKRGVVYNKIGLPTNIVERNYVTKSIKIYKIEYSFIY